MYCVESTYLTIHAFMHKKPLIMINIHRKIFVFFPLDKNEMKNLKLYKLHNIYTVMAKGND